MARVKYFPCVLDGGKSSCLFAEKNNNIFKFPFDQNLIMIFILD